ncbi:MAG: membrane-bound lytic murein transglycosylase MltF [Halioglobus sp.]|jgi:membrane-bound lytic murein transglycosylase MltF
MFARKVISLIVFTFAFFLAQPISLATEQSEAKLSKNPGKFLLTHSEHGLPPELVPITKAWSGDFDGMLERRVVRILTVYQLGNYFLDGPKQKGMTYDVAKMFEKFLNERQGSGHVKIHVVLIPVEFDQLLNGLVQGYGDIAIAGISATETRDKIVDFSNPFSKNVSEIIITGPASPQIDTLDDLAGKQVFAKPGSSYLESLATLSAGFEAKGLEAIDIKQTDPLLEDVELLEMVGAGLLPLLVMDNYKARFWGSIFSDMKIREDLVIQSGRRLAWAFRENSPLLAAEVNEFSKDHRQGSLMGNILIKRYLKNTKWAKNALDPEGFEKFNQTIAMFERYAGQYGFDHLMIAAQGYQESRLDQSVRSSAGAVGIMQLLPTTAADKNVGIPDIATAEANIHAGVKYLHFVRNRYFEEEGLDDLNATLLSFAAYNAGPARVRSLRRKATAAGLDPNKWFNNVELIAAKDIGRETVQYVSNIYKYYIAYSLMNEKQLNKDLGS